MNDEIKEILEDIKRIQKSDYDKLLDYITNSQEEIEKIQEENEQLMSARYSLDRVELEQRIDKAIEYINSDEMLKLREEFEYCNDKDLFDEFAGHLDRILRGSDKE